MRYRNLLSILCVCLLLSACANMQRRPMGGGGGKRPANRNADIDRDRFNQNEELRLENQELRDRLDDFQALFGGRGIHQGQNNLDGSPGFRPDGINQIPFNDQFGSLATRDLNSRFSGSLGNVDVPGATPFVGNEFDQNNQGHSPSGRGRILRRLAN